MTGDAGTDASCTQAAADACELSDILAFYPEATISYSVGVAKGTDYEFQGAVDGLRINDTIYDFEPFGVIETPA